MTIANFNPEEFSQNLAKQAQELVPSDLSDYQKNYIINKLYQFCILAGNALNQDTNTNFTSAEANIIVQLIGEWTFHKNIDLIRANIEEECWDPVLQQIAFAVFEAAKHVQTNKIEQNQAIKLIEDIVKDSYNKSLMELAKKGKINEEKIPEIMSYSNIDAMAEETPPEIPKEQEDKILKCASLALVLKSLPTNKVNKILSGMDEETVRQIMYFISMQDLEQKIDSNLANNILSGFKQNVSGKKSAKTSKPSGKIGTLKDLYDEYFIMKQTKFERPVIQKFVQNSLNPKPEKSGAKVSSYIENVVYEYLISKLTT